jgi:hypothetical protein
MGRNSKRNSHTKAQRIAASLASPSKGKPAEREQNSQSGDVKGEKTGKGKLSSGKPPKPRKLMSKPAISRAGVSQVWKEIWAYLGPAVAILGFWFSFKPTIAITSGSTLDPSQVFGTMFVVTNTGRIPVHNVHFTCSIHAISNKIFVQNLTSEGKKVAPIDILPPSVPISRVCFTKSLLNGETMQKVVVHYTWPIIGATDSETAWFSSQRGASGSVLTREVNPSSEPPALMQIRS